MGVQIEGLDECYSWMERSPKNALKLTKKASQAGAKAMIKLIKADTPSQYRKLIRYKVDKNRSGEIETFAGLFNNAPRNTSGKEIPEWFKAYWDNYGTLTHRSSAHQFKFAVKKTAKRKNNVGQDSQGWFDEHNGQLTERFMSAFEDYLVKHENDFYEK